MAVFQALRNKAQSGLAGLVTSSVKSALGLNRAAGLRFPDVDSSSRPRGNSGTLLQYPLDLGSTGNNHFIAFFLRQREASILDQEDESGGSDVATVARSSGQFIDGGVAADFELAAASSPSLEADALTKTIKANVAGAQGRTHDGKSLVQRLAPTSRIGGSVAMYFPPTVTEEYQVAYSETEVGIATVATADIIEGFMQQGLTKEFFKGAKDAALRGFTTFALDKVLRGAEILPGFSGARGAVGVARGKVIVPKMEVMFEGVGKRKFSYTFIFTPSSEQEADEVHRIIKFFRVNAAPDYTNALGIEMTIPNTFDIAYYTGAIENGYLHKIGECHLTSVGVTHGGDKMTFHKPTASGKAMPTRTTMTLNFAELETVTRSLIEEQGF